jgi:RimJ/RimL family protein N-acetyltransferase/SAM-dependent methyltransferase
LFALDVAMSFFLIGQHVALRSLEMSDGAAFHRWFADRDVVRYSMTMWQLPMSQVETDAWLERQLNDKETLTLGIIERETGQLIGYAGISGMSRINRRGEYYILIGEKDCWGKGYGTETTKLIVEHGFNSLNLNRIMLTVSASNIGAIKAYSNAGFVKEGVMRQVHYRDGHYHDELVMAILRSEWDERRDSNQKLDQARAYWDGQAASFDNEPDHGLRDPIVSAAWAELLGRWLPAEPAKILDAGCGTGSLSTIMAQMGHDVSGIDLSPAMVAHARAKALDARQDIRFDVMDASHPNLSSNTFDVIVCRHLLWALSEPDRVLRRWVNLLAPNGRLILIEGFWVTGSGLHADEIVKLLPASLTRVAIEHLSGLSNLWGGEVIDERYAIIADLITETGC